MGKDKCKTNLDDSTKEALVVWVSDFLWYWEGSSMRGDKAAEIIVNHVLTCQRGEDQNGLCRLPEPQSFFESQG